MFRNKSTDKKEARERVIIGEEIVNVAELRAEAKKAGTRFWVLLVLVSLISSMVVPYLSMASIAAEGTTVFQGDVIPGYSMGGIEIPSYGVDINSWGQSAKQTSSNPVITKSQYGYWTEKRAANASQNLTRSISADRGDENADLNGLTLDDGELTNDEKARGWIGITRDKGEGTGLSGFSTDPSGTSDSNRKRFNESVAPYRTQEDWKYWDTHGIGGSTPTITTTLYPDFVIFGWDEENKTARTLTNPDDIQNSSSSKGGAAGAIEGTSAVPHYVPLSTLYEEFGLGDTVMSQEKGHEGEMNDLDALFDAIMEESQKKGNDGKSPTLNKIVENKGNDPKYDLLIGTHYDNLNGENKSTEPGSDAWNPYPYSMVFKASSSSGTVVSSIYNNTEAYVYFSPRSVYNNYMSLRSEYDSLVNASSVQVADAQPQAAFQLGYYLAGMSILEAYLNEALPQDMTRGYVGPSEGNPIASATSSLSNGKKLLSRSSSSGNVVSLFAQSLSSVNNMSTADGSKNEGAVGFRSVAYSQLMYDFADAAIVKYGADGEGSWLGATSAIMNTLSTYGYGVRDSGQNTNTDKASAGQGPNRGMTRRQNMARVTMYGPYAKSAGSLNVSVTSDKDDPLLNPGIGNSANTGMYVPVYYPIQQHEMPTDTEMPYRFQVLSLIPYSTLSYELGRHGFDSNISLSYNNKAVETLDATKHYYNKVASLGRQLDELNSGAGAALGSYDKGKSIILNPQTNTTSMVGDQTTSQYAKGKDSTERVDNALMSFQSGLMNADNVHDLVDIMRAVPGVKYETFVRYYNPIKSSGGADDIYLTRITPAQTAYMPSVLTAGYESAGGVTNNESITNTANANFDYFSIPSFGPCFAAKTAEETYYGSLNYELRPFYTKGFLNSLPADTNIPALEQYEELQEEIEETTGQAIEGMKTKILTIYVLAKRLAFARAYGKLLSAESADGSMSVGGFYNASDGQSTVESGSAAATGTVREALTPTNPQSYPVPANDNGKDSFSGQKSEGSAPSNVDVVGASDNKIETTTLSNGVEFGISADQTQASVDGTVVPITVSDDGTIDVQGGVSAGIAEQVKGAWQQQQDDIATALALAAGGGGFTTGSDYYDTTGSTAGTTGATSGSLPPWVNNLKDRVDGLLNNITNIVMDAGFQRTSHTDTTSETSPHRTAPGTAYGDIVTSGGARLWAWNRGIATNIIAEPIRWLAGSLQDAICPKVAYAAPSSEAQQVYEKDKLKERGYIQAPEADWAELKKSMSVSDSISFHIPSDMTIPHEGDFDYAMQEFGPKHIIGDDILTKQVIWCKTSGGLAFVTDLKTVFAALYNDAYTHFLAPKDGDSYYWDTPDEIAKYDVDIDTDQMMLRDEKLHYNTVGIGYSDASNEDKARTNLDAYCEQAFEELDAIMKELQMLNDKLPKQMQNVLAWADTQSASESETNYQVSPDENVLEIELGVKEDDSKPSNTIHSLYDAEKCGFLPYDNGGDYALVEAAYAESATGNLADAQRQGFQEDEDMQARTIRGVSGTTATPSERLAAYTITSTVARIDWFAPTASSSSSIPYAGIYTGSLNSGTDKYAILQAHTIDREAVSSSLAGDLRSRSASTVQASLANPESTTATQRFVQSEGVFVNELQAAVIPNAVSMMQTSIAQTMPSDDSSTTQPIKSATAGTLGGSLLSGTDSLTMARASTFDDATMNRESAVSVAYNSNTKQMVYQSGGSSRASASAISQDRQLAESLVDGAFSDTYATIQSVALLLVLAFLMIIAFQNFVGYTSGNEAEYINAQTKLRTVLPRALIAVAMIGLPPIGGQQGFQGGCFLLLQIVNALVDSVMGSVTGGTDVFNTLIETLTAQFEVKFDLLGILTNLFDILLNLLASVLFLVGSIFVVLLCLATDVVLFLFWMVGPLVWAFYVWPYSASEARSAAGKRSTTGFLGKVTGYMGLKSFTHNEVGRDAPSGWVMGYMSTLSTIVVWNLVFWVFSIVFTMLQDGTGVTEAMNTVASNASKADIHIDNPGVVDLGSAGDLINGQAPHALPSGGFGHLLLAILFLLVVYVMYRIFKNTMGGAMKFMYGTVGFAAKATTSFALGHVAAAARGVDLASKASKALEARNMTDTVLGKAISVGAKGLDAGIHSVGAVDNIVNSPAAADAGKRLDKFIDNFSKDVKDRDRTSGVLDDLVAVETTTDEDGNVTGTRLRVSPVAQGAVDLAKRQTAGFREMKLRHHQNKTLSQMTALANNENRCRERLQAYKDVDAVDNRLAGMKGQGDDKAKVSDLTADMRSRLEAHTSGSHRLSDDEMRTLTSDAALLGIKESQVKSMADGKTSAEDMRKTLEDARKRTEKRVSERDTIRQQQGNIQERVSSLLARAESIDSKFGEQAREHWGNLQTDEILTEGQRATRRVGTVAKGVASQAATAASVATGASAIENISGGGRLGAGALAETTAQGVYQEWDAYEMQEERKSERSDEFKELASAATGANEAVEVSDEKLGEYAASVQSDNVAALDRLRDQQED